MYPISKKIKVKAIVRKCNLSISEVYSCLKLVQME